MLSRVLEPEVMDTAEEAAEYDAMDHSAVNAKFCEDLLLSEPAPRRVVDVGTGTALIPIELCKRSATAHVVATDLAEHMLSLAKKNVAAAGFGDRIETVRVDAKGSHLPAASFDVVMSNSIIHHVPEPSRAFAEMLRLLAPKGLLFVRDLARPASDAEVATLVDRYAAGETASARALFEASLRAALTPGEVGLLLAALGVPADAVRMTSDRHWTVAWRK